MKTVYACTYARKEAEEDRYAGGCVPGTRTCVMAQGCGITADTLPGLLKEIGNYFCLDLDDVWLGDGDGGELSRIGYSRQEDDAGYPPEAVLVEKWREGKCRLYLADYSFAVEKRQVCDLTRAEFEAAGVKFHD
jgi:hypothetical protein